MVPVFFIPFFGFCCLAVLEWSTRVHPDARKDVGIEKLKINDEIHRSILMEEEPAQNLMVPLQEALLINDANTRRELIMDILYHDTGEYVEVLQKARYNDDVEVVHYATTAMVELQKDYEEELAMKKAAWESEPDSEQRQMVYSQVLESYIKSGLLEGNIKKERQSELCSLLERQIGVISDSRMAEPELYLKLFANSIELDRFKKAAECADCALAYWPDLEYGYLMKLQLAIEKKDGGEIQNIIAQIEQREIYLSMDARKIVEFWKEDNEGSQERTEKR